MRRVEWRKGGSRKNDNVPDSEEFTGGRSQSDVGSSVEMNGSLGEHGVVLELGSSKGRAISGDDNELGSTGAHLLEGRLEAEGVLSGLDDERELAVDVVRSLLGLFDRGSGRSHFTEKFDSSDFRSPVTLYRRTTSREGERITHEMWRVKVNTDEGKNRARVKIPHLRNFHRFFTLHPFSSFRRQTTSNAFDRAS